MFTWLSYPGLKRSVAPPTGFRYHNHMRIQTADTLPENKNPDLELDYRTFSYAVRSDPFFKRFLIRSIEKLTGQLKIWRLYREYQSESKVGDETFWQAACRKLEISLSYDRDKLQDIPKTGPLVAVANHPYGVLDGLILCHLMSQIRPDFKVLTNSVLTRSPEVKDNLLPIDFAGTPEALQTNLYSRKKARETLRDGGAIAVFPAGGVSSIPSWSDKIAQDAPWQPFIGQLIRQSEATVVPIYFEGQNSRLFQMASLMSQTLRLSLFFKELSDQIGSQISLEIGEPIAFENLPTFVDQADLMEKLRYITYALAQR